MLSDTFFLCLFPVSGSSNKPVLTCEENVTNENISLQVKKKQLWCKKEETTVASGIFILIINNNLNNFHSKPFLIESAVAQEVEQSFAIRLVCVLIPDSSCHMSRFPWAKH